MRDKFIFSNAQDLTAVDSTGVVSTNVWDLEEDASVDQQVCGWLNVSFGASNAGATEGMYIEFRSSAAAALTSPVYLVSVFLTDAELTAAAGKTYAVGIYKANLEKYAGVWYRAHTTGLAATATPVDAWFSIAPEGELRLQKKPA